MWINITNNSLLFQGDKRLLNPISNDFIRSFEITVCILLLSLCIAGNSVVIYVIYRHRQMRTITNFLLGNLAAADLCMAVFHTGPNLYLLIAEDWILGDGPLGQACCKAYSYMRSVSYHGSIHVLMLIAIERFLAIVHPFGSRGFLLSRSFLRASVIGAWLLALLVSIPNVFFMVWKHEYRSFDGTDVGQTMCIRDGYHTNTIHWRSYDFCLFLLWFALPLVTMVIFYTLVGRKLARSAQLRRGRGGFRAHDVSIMTYQTLVGSSRRYATRVPDKTASLIKNSPDYQSAAATDSETNTRLMLQNDTAAKTSCNGTEAPISEGGEMPPMIARESTSEDSNDNGSQLIRSSERPTELAVFNIRRQRFLSPFKSNGSISSYVIEERKRVIRVLVVMVAVFAICWLPMHLRKFIFHNFKYSFWHTYLPTITDWMIVVHGTLNPLIYAIFSSRFRDCVREVLCRHPNARNAFYRRCQLSPDHDRLHQEAAV